MNISDITPGSSWACEFTTTTWLDNDGSAVQAPNLNLGEVHPGKPGTYTSIGVIRVRDVEQELVELVDTRSECVFTVPWSACSRVEPVEWIDGQ